MSFSASQNQVDRLDGAASQCLVRCDPIVRLLCFFASAQDIQRDFAALSASELEALEKRSANSKDIARQNRAERAQSERAAASGGAQPSQAIVPASPGPERTKFMVAFNEQSKCVCCGGGPTGMHSPAPVPLYPVIAQGGAARNPSGVWDIVTAGSSTSLTQAMTPSTFQAVKGSQSFHKIADQFRSTVEPFAIRKTASQFPAHVDYPKQCGAICGNSPNRSQLRMYKDTKAMIDKVASGFGSGPKLATEDVLLMFSAIGTEGVQCHVFFWLGLMHGRHAHHHATQTLTKLDRQLDDGADAHALPADMVGLRLIFTRDVHVHADPWMHMRPILRRQNGGGFMHFPEDQLACALVSEMLPDGQVPSQISVRRIRFEDESLDILVTAGCGHEGLEGWSP